MANPFIKYIIIAIAMLIASIYMVIVVGTVVGPIGKKVIQDEGSAITGFELVPMLDNPKALLVKNMVIKPTVDQIEVNFNLQSLYGANAFPNFDIRVKDKSGQSKLISLDASEYTHSSSNVVDDKISLAIPRNGSEVSITVLPVYRK